MKTSLFKSFHRRFVVLSTITILMLTSLFCSNIQDTQAASNTNLQVTTSTVEKVKVGLNINCTETLKTAKGRAAAKKRNVCQTPDEVHLNGSSVARGNCGWVTISMYAKGNGNIVIGQAFVSTLGRMSIVRYGVAWNNVNTNNVYSRYAVPLQVSYTDNQSIHTGTGLIKGAIVGAYVTMLDNTVCGGLNPTTDVIAT